MYKRRPMEFPENKWLCEKLVKAWELSGKTKTEFLRDLGFKPHSEINITYAFSGQRGFSFPTGLRVIRALKINVLEEEISELKNSDPQS